MTRRLTYRPRKVILKGTYYCPIVPELGHYENEGMWGYDKLIHIEKCRYKIVSCLFNTEKERDDAYQTEINNLMKLGKAMLKRRTCCIEEELDDLEMISASSAHAHKVVEGKTIRLIV
jgi:hypothetical protein